MRLPASLILFLLASSESVATEMIVDADPILTRESLPIGVLTRTGGGQEVLFVDARNPAFCKRRIVYVHGELLTEEVVDEIAAGEFDTQYKIMSKGSVCTLDMPSRGFHSFDGAKEEADVLEKLLTTIARWKLDGSGLDVAGVANLVECVREDAVELVSFSRTKGSEYEVLLSSVRCGSGSGRLMTLISGAYDPQHSTLRLTTRSYSRDP